jgi:hypothetical protein
MNQLMEEEIKQKIIIKKTTKEAEQRKATIEEELKLVRQDRLPKRLD